MALEIGAVQLCETSVACCCMSVLLPITNYCRVRYSGTGATVWYFFHSKGEESRLHRAFFFTIWALGSTGAAVCWALALAAYHRPISDHAAVQFYIACHGLLVLVAAAFEIYEVGWLVALCLDQTTRRRRFLPACPWRTSLYAVFLVIAAAAITIVAMAINSPDDGPIGLTLLGMVLLLSRGYNMFLAGVLWRSCYCWSRFSSSYSSEKGAKTNAMHNSTIFMLSLLLLVLERWFWPTHVGAQYLLSMWHPANFVLGHLFSIATSLLRCQQYAQHLEDEPVSGARTTR